MRMTALSESRDLIERLASHRLPSAGGIEVEVGRPQRIPGAAGSVWQLLVDLAVVGAPMALAVDLLGEWIKSTLGSSPPGARLRLVVRDGERTVETEISGTLPDEIFKAVATAVAEAHRKP